MCYGCSRSQRRPAVGTAETVSLQRISKLLAGFPGLGIDREQVALLLAAANAPG